MADTGQGEEGAGRHLKGGARGTGYGSIPAPATEIESNQVYNSLSVFVLDTPHMSDALVYKKNNLASMIALAPQNQSISRSHGILVR